MGSGGTATGDGASQADGHKAHGHDVHGHDVHGHDVHGHDADAEPGASEKAPGPAPARGGPSRAEKADKTDKTSPVPLVAPPWTGRVYYLVGGTLPKTYTAWVSHDLTAPGWRRRQAARTGLLLLPVACVFALLPGPIGVRATIVGFIAATALALGFGAAGYFRNRRLLQHGFPPVFGENDD